MERTWILEGEEIASELAECSAFVARWHGASVRVWRYHASLSRLALCIWDRESKERLFLIAARCEHLHGPFYWHDNAIQAVLVSGLHGPMIGLVDVKAVFLLKCKLVSTLISEHHEFEFDEEDKKQNDRTP